MIKATVVCANHLNSIPASTAMLVQRDGYTEPWCTPCIKREKKQKSVVRPYLKVKKKKT